MLVVHICAWAGIHTDNCNALAQYSRHRHIQICHIQHPYAGMKYKPCWLSEANTDRETLEQLVAEADVLEFHPFVPEETHIHSIDWNRYRAHKLWIIHGICSYPTMDGTGWEVRNHRFEITNPDRFDMILGPHLSCKLAYRLDRLQYVPDIVPIHDVLYTPLAGTKQNFATTFKCFEALANCRSTGIDLRQWPTPTPQPKQLAWRREHAKASADNIGDGHWGLFGMESLSQGVPCATWVHPVNLDCFSELGVPKPPFSYVDRGGADLPGALKAIMDMQDDEWRDYSSLVRQWVEQYYEPRALVRRWDVMYDLLEKQGRV